MKNSFILLFLALNIFSTSSHAMGSKKPKLPNGSGSTTTPTAPVTPTTPSSPSSSSLITPWKNAETSIVIDAYEKNSIDWNQMATDRKVAGVIHRASSGTKADTQYVSRKKIAKERGYLWGAYHLAKKGNPIAQANFFLSIIS